jgi:hypothetical protein
MGKVNLKKSITTTSVAALAATLVAGCSGNGTSPQGVTTVNPTTGVLQLSVGTANIYGDGGAGTAVTGLNVATTFRQPRGAQTPGDTAALVNTPTLTGSFVNPTYSTGDEVCGSTVRNAPSASDAGTSTITGTLPVNPGTTLGPGAPGSTFGISGGVTGSGIEPFNYSTAGSCGGFGVPTTFTPYKVPLYDAFEAGGSMAFRPWGGPPAFDPNHDGKGTRDNSGFPSGVNGVSMGLDVFANTTVTSGSITLSTVVPTSSSSNQTLSKTATLASTALLPAVSAVTPNADGAGGASFAAVLPPGVTEGLIELIDIGPVTGANTGTSCNGADAAPVYYTVYVGATGTVSLPDNDGPGNPGSAIPSICTAAQNTTANGKTTDGDSVLEYFIGFDYPAYEAMYPQSIGNPSPTLTGANGQSDITISSEALFEQPAGGGGGGSYRRAPSATTKAIEQRLRSRFRNIL